MCRILSECVDVSGLAGDLKIKTLAINSIRAFSEIDLPESSQFRHRTYWKDVGDAINYYVGLKMGNLKLAMNRRPLLRLTLLPIARAAHALWAKLAGVR